MHLIITECFQRNSSSETVLYLSTCTIINPMEMQLLTEECTNILSVDYVNCNNHHTRPSYVSTKNMAFCGLVACSLLDSDLLCKHGSLFQDP